MTSTQQREKDTMQDALNSCYIMTPDGDGYQLVDMETKRVVFRTDWQDFAAIQDFLRAAGEEAREFLELQEDVAGTYRDDDQHDAAVRVESITDFAELQAEAMRMTADPKRRAKILGRLWH